jgi:hypothetical protein
VSASFARSTSRSKRQSARSRFGRLIINAVRSATAGPGSTRATGAASREPLACGSGQRAERPHGRRRAPRRRERRRQRHGRARLLRRARGRDARRREVRRAVRVERARVRGRAGRERALHGGDLRRERGRLVQAADEATERELDERADERVDVHVVRGHAREHAHVVRELAAQHLAPHDEREPGEVVVLHRQVERAREHGVLVALLVLVALRLHH